MTMIFGIPVAALMGQLLVGLINGSFYALLSLGLAVIFGLLRVINFAHGAQYMLGAFTALLLLTVGGVNYWLALIAAPLIVGLFGAIIERTMLSRLYQLDHLYGLLFTFGLALAMGTRILLLLSIAWVMRLTNDLFTVLGEGVSGRDLILFFGGLFLLFKSTLEIWHSVEGEEEEQTAGGAAKAGFVGIILQIAVIDIVFSLDSVITAVGLVQHVPVMVAAIVIAVLVMMVSAGTIADFIDKHPTLKILALSFLIVVGTLLIAEAFDVHVPKGYVYFAMAFSLGVEALNIRMRKAMKRKLKEPVKLGKGSPD